ncbi:MAG: sulfate reduction electron transfer complex DsrMKJOP subunit DsrM [Polyangiaceae bacterium]|nr:sulfate reduction electron transfer complex DsrMKJOP subunit DsrM [Polyangiaceae bacterium]
MKAISALVAVLALFLIAYFAAPYVALVFGVIVPYVAIAVFLVGVVARVLTWAKAPVPFAIGTTCGQQKTHPWIKYNELENPSTTLGVVGRMALEVLFFRSLFRNTKMTVKAGGRVTYDGEWVLWAAGLAFHWSFLMIVLRHMRFFAEPVPFFVPLIQSLDGFFELGVPTLYVTSVALLAAVTALFLRRVLSPQLRYLSLAADYFPLFLIGAIAATGIVMRHFMKTDVVGIKELAVGLVTFNPQTSANIAPIFYAHLFLVCALLAYFPFSKLVHMAGVFMSPTRNLRCNSREVRHINPWNREVKTHTYEQYEDEFRDKMKACGLPVDRDAPAK